MRRAFATLFFVLGCVLAAFAIAWFAAARMGMLIAPRTASGAVVCFIFYAALMLGTMDRASARDWRPVLVVTQSRITVARLLLSAVGGICLVTIVFVIAGRASGNVSVVDSAFAWVIGSLLLLNGVYVALHWGYRPQNIFGPNVPPSLLNPLGIVLVPILKMTGVIKSSPENGHGRKKNQPARVDVARIGISCLSRGESIKWQSPCEASGNTLV